MAGKNDERARIFQQVHKDRNAGNLDAALSLLFRVEIEQLVQKHIFGDLPAHMSPGGQRDGLDFGLGFVRKSIAQIGQHQPVALQLRPNEPHQPISTVQGFIGRKQFQQRQQDQDELGHQPLRKSPQAQHDLCQNPTEHDQSIFRMILPKIWRLSIRVSATSMSSNVTCVSITG